MTCFRFIPARASTSVEVVDPALAEASRNTKQFREACPGIGTIHEKVRFGASSAPVCDRRPSGDRLSPLGAATNLPNTNLLSKGFSVRYDYFRLKMNPAAFGMTSTRGTALQKRVCVERKDTTRSLYLP